MIPLELNGFVDGRRLGDRDKPIIPSASVSAKARNTAISSVQGQKRHFEPR
jgi:hypothetical protein